MARNDGFLRFVLDEALREVGGISARGMFGGWGIYKDGVFFALIASDTLYFKVDDRSRADYEALGARPFVYEGHKGKQMTMSYYQVPPSILEDPHEIGVWVQAAYEAAVRARRKRSS